MDIVPDDGRRAEVLTNEPKKTFGELLDRNDYHRDPDGADHCGSCWNTYLNQFEPEDRDQIVKDSKKSSALLKNAQQTLRVREGWRVDCRGTGETDEGDDDIFSNGKPCPNKASIFVSDDGKTININR